MDFNQKHLLDTKRCGSLATTAKSCLIVVIAGGAQLTTSFRILHDAGPSSMCLYLSCISYVFNMSISFSDASTLNSTDA